MADEQGVKNKLNETPIQEPQTETPGLQYRYVCPACTNVAFYAHDKSQTADVCHNCGSALGKIEQGNFIALTDAQKEALKQQGL